MLLVAQITLQPLEKWAMDFVSPINPPGRRTSAWYIIIENDYMTRWEEETSMKDCRAVMTVKFLFEKVATIFGCPKILMRD